MSEWMPKRFWKQAEVQETEAGFTVLLDGRGVKTPGKRTLSVPTRDLAQALSAEWDAQEDKINPETMPFTRLTNSAIDKVALQHAVVADMLAEYGGSDLLCYRAQQPAILKERQARAWDGLLDWAAQAHGITLTTQAGLMPVAQPDEAVAKVNALTQALDPFQLTAFHELVTLSGSWVIGYAALTTEQDPETLWESTLVDEYFQEEQWGKDEEALKMRATKRDAFLRGHEFGVLTRRA